MRFVRQGAACKHVGAKIVLVLAVRARQSRELSHMQLQPACKQPLLQ